MQAPSLVYFISPSNFTPEEESILQNVVGRVLEEERFANCRKKMDLWTRQIEDASAKFAAKKKIKDASTNKLRTELDAALISRNREIGIIEEFLQPTKFVCETKGNLTLAFNELIEFFCKKEELNANQMKKEGELTTKIDEAQKQFFEAIDNYLQCVRICKFFHDLYKDKKDALIKEIVKNEEEMQALEKEKDQEIEKVKDMQALFEWGNVELIEQFKAYENLRSLFSSHKNIKLSVREWTLGKGLFNREMEKIQKLKSKQKEDFNCKLRDLEENLSQFELDKLELPAGVKAVAMEDKKKINALKEKIKTKQAAIQVLKDKLDPLQVRHKEALTQQRAERFSCPGTNDEEESLRQQVKALGKERYLAFKELTLLEQEFRESESSLKAKLQVYVGPKIEERKRENNNVLEECERIIRIYQKVIAD